MEGMEARDAPLRRDVRLLGDLLGQVLVEQEDESLLADVERVRALARAVAGRRAARGAPGGGRGAAARAPGERAARVRALLPARERRRAASPRSPAAGLQARGARPRGVARRLVRAARRRAARGARAPGLAAARPDRASDRGDATHGARLAPAHRGAARRARRPDARAGRAAPRSRRRSPARSPRTGRPTRCARAGRASSTRSGTGTGSSSRASSTRRSACSPTTAACCPARRRRCAGARGSAATPTATRMRARETITEALDRARRLLRLRYRDEVRALAAEIGVSSRLTPVDDDLLASIERDERELPEYADAIGDQNLDEPYRRKLTFMWNRLDADGYATADDFADDLAIIDRSLRANRGARIADGALAALRRRVELFGLHLAKLDVRTHARDLVDPDERMRGIARGRRRGAQAARPAGARHVDRLRHRLGRRRAPRARADGRAAVGRAALRVGRGAPRRAARSTASCSTPSAAAR